MITPRQFYDNMSSDSGSDVESDVERKPKSTKKKTAGKTYEWKVGDEFNYEPPAESMAEPGMYEILHLGELGHTHANNVLFHAPGDKKALIPYANMSVVRLVGSMKKSDTHLAMVAIPGEKKVLPTLANATRGKQAIEKAEKKMVIDSQNWGDGRPIIPWELYAKIHQMRGRHKKDEPCKKRSRPEAEPAAEVARPLAQKRPCVTDPRAAVRHRYDSDSEPEEGSRVTHTEAPRLTHTDKTLHEMYKGCIKSVLENEFKNDKHRMADWLRESFERWIDIANGSFSLELIDVWQNTYDLADNEARQDMWNKGKQAIQILHIFAPDTLKAILREQEPNV